MDLMNGSGSVLKHRYDGRWYEFKPLEVVSLPEESGGFLARKLKRQGLIEVHFGDDETEVRLKAARNVLAHHRRVLASHNRAQHLQNEKGFEALPDSQAVRKAKREIPLYEKFVGKLSEKVSHDEESEEVARLNAALESFLSADKLEGDLVRKSPTEVPIDEIRDELRKRNVEFSNHWGRAKLLAALEEAVKKVEPAAAANAEPAAAAK